MHENLILKLALYYNLRNLFPKTWCLHIVIKILNSLRTAPKKEFAPSRKIINKQNKIKSQQSTGKPFPGKRTTIHCEKEITFWVKNFLLNPSTTRFFAILFHPTKQCSKEIGPNIFEENATFKKIFTTPLSQHDRYSNFRQKRTK